MVESEEEERANVVDVCVISYGKFQLSGISEM